MLTTHLDDIVSLLKAMTLPIRLKIPCRLRGEEASVGGLEAQKNRTTEQKN